MDIRNELKNYYMAVTKEPAKLKVLLIAFDNIVLPKLQDKMSDDEIYAFMIGNFTFFPAVAEILKVINKTPDKNDLKQEASIWWAKMKEVAARIGSYHNVSFIPIINDWIKSLGGWPQFCSQTHEEMKFLEYRFIDYYSGCKQARMTGKAKMLSGLQTIPEKTYMIDFEGNCKLIETEEIKKIENKGQNLIENLSNKLTPF